MERGWSTWRVGGANILDPVVAIVWCQENLPGDRWQVIDNDANADWIVLGFAPNNEVLFRMSNPCIPMIPMPKGA